MRTITLGFNETIRNGLAEKRKLVWCKNYGFAEDAIVKRLKNFRRITCNSENASICLHLQHSNQQSGNNCKPNVKTSFAHQFFPFDRF
jgi:hypothetical protein